jgi:hypothetical protein
MRKSREGRMGASFTIVQVHTTGREPQQARAQLIHEVQSWALEGPFGEIDNASERHSKIRRTDRPPGRSVFEWCQAPRKGRRSGAGDTVACRPLHRQENQPIGIVYCY